MISCSNYSNCKTQQILLLAKLEQERRRRNEILNPTKKTINKNLLESSYYEYVKQAWPWIDPNQFADGWHIKFICDHLQAFYEDKIQNLLINIPPGYGKSLLCSVMFPTWCWTKNPSLRFLTGSKAVDLAIRDCRKSRILLSSEWYQDLWGDKWNFSSDENTKSSYENDKGGFRNVFSTGGNVTGFRGDFRIFDDPHDASESHNPDALAKTCEWYGTVFSTRGDILKPSKTLLIMQRLAEDDMSGFFLKSQKDFWTHVCLPLEYEPVRKCVTPIGFDPREKEGELLWDKVKLEEIEKLKINLGSNGVAGQLQQRPNKPGGNIFKEDWFRRYHIKDIPRLDYILLSIDTGWKKKEENDPSVLQVWGVRDLNIYLIDMWRGKESFKSLTKRCVDKYNEYLHFQAHCTIEKMLIEEKAAGVSISQVLEEETHIPIKKINPHDPKEVRAHAVTPICESNRVWIPYDRDFIDIFMDEVVSFPKGTNDDIVDAMTQALSYIQTNNSTSWYSLCT